MLHSANPPQTSRQNYTFSDEVYPCLCADINAASHLPLGVPLGLSISRATPWVVEMRTAFLLGDSCLVFAGLGPSLSLGWLHSELSCLWPVLLLSARLTTDRTSWFQHGLSKVIVFRVKSSSNQCLPEYVSALSSESSEGPRTLWIPLTSVPTGSFRVFIA